MMPRKTMHKGEMKRYNLVLPQTLFDEIQTMADRKGVTVLDVLRKFIKLGLIVVALEDQPDSKLIIRTGDTEKEVILI
jgi:hypothetical protein